MKVRKWICILLAALMLLSLTACGAENTGSMNGYDMEYSYEQDDMLYREPGSEGQTEIELPANRKWIITVDMDAETEDMDVLLVKLNEQIAALDGYVEDQNIYNGSTYSSRRYRNASLTIRIPADKVDAFTEEVSGMSNIVSSNKSLKDVTLSYVDTESRLAALEAEEARLLELMEQAETMSDLLEIEERLTDVRYQMESAASQLRTYDNLVDYATIHLSIDEVQEYTPTVEKTFWQRVSEGFVDSLQGLWNFFVGLVEWILVKLPYLVFLGAFVVLIVWLCSRKSKKKGNQPKKPPFPMPENQDKKE